MAGFRHYVLLCDREEEVERNMQATVKDFHSEANSGKMGSIFL